MDKKRLFFSSSLTPRNKSNRRVLSCYACLAVAVACSSPHTPTLFDWQDPPGFPRMVVPADNPFSREGVALGRRLFYDPILSADSSMSCASCHLQQLAFSDGKARSEGVVGLEGRRSAPSLANIGYAHTGLFWDGRSPSLEEQSLHPVRDAAEMAFDWHSAAQRLRHHPLYVTWFKKAFGLRRPSEIDSTEVGKALAQFQRTLISKDALFDRVLRGEAAFSAREKRGWTIFFDASPLVPASECNHCHVDPLFTDLTYQNNGIQQVPSLDSFPDAGRGEISKNRFDNGKFRVPTLRNIFTTAPYMHDGRFQTLEEVLDHYTSGGHDPGNRNPNVRPLHLSPRDRADLLAFLHTLQDTAFLQNPAFANPWSTSQ